VAPQFAALLDDGLLRHDLTELAGLDYLASPTGPIAEAQAAAAAAFHADHTWFLVNGSSGGLHAAIMSVAGPGDMLVVARNCHQAVFSGMVLAGCTPWWVSPEVDNTMGVPHCVSPEAARQAIRAARLASPSGGRVAGLLVVSPTYFGACADVRGMEAVGVWVHAVPTFLLDSNTFGTRRELSTFTLHGVQVWRECAPKNM
jgi:arginine/lysine/ornithine decarboxylase